MNVIQISKNVIVNKETIFNFKKVLNFYRLVGFIILKCYKTHIMPSFTKISVILFLVVFGCNKPDTSKSIETWKSEIMQVEQDFNDMAQKKGLVEAFHTYAAEDGVIRRGKKVVKGKSNIREWYRNDVRPNETLTWKPTFVDVSSSGDLAYTYGDYIFTSTDSTGAKKESTGIFHTVWKRQEDGRWRFVWD